MLRSGKSFKKVKWLCNLYAPDTILTTQVSVFYMLVVGI